MQNTGNDYAEVSKKLIFTFNRPNHANPEGIAMHDKENEVRLYALLFFIILKFTLPTKSVYA